MALKKIEDLPSAGTLTGSELFELSQSSTSVNATLQTVLSARLIPVEQYITATGAYNANVFDAIIADTSTAAFTITLPLSPAFGNTVWFIDGAGTWNSNNLTVAGNGSKILGNTGNLIATTARDNFSLVYYNTVQGWIIGD